MSRHKQNTLFVRNSRAGAAAVRRASGASREKTGGDPGNEGYDEQPDNQRREIAPDALQTGAWVNLTDRTCGVVTEPEGRCEKADAHGEDDDHRIMHLVHAELLRHRKQQRTE
jgi:hypothetical protein